LSEGLQRSGATFNLYRRLVLGTSEAAKQNTAEVEMKKKHSKGGRHASPKGGRRKQRLNSHRMRALIIPDHDGLRTVSVDDSETASTIAAYSNAVQKYLRTGDASALMLFSRVSLRDADGEPIDLLTDLSTLRRLGSAGVLSFESLYARMS
jgi:hypothetical protein